MEFATSLRFFPVLFACVGGFLALLIPAVDAVIESRRSTRIAFGISLVGAVALLLIVCAAFG